MSKTHFANVDKIPYEGPDSDNRLAFKYYNANEQVMGKTQAEHLRFAAAYWHSLTSLGSDKFGDPTIQRPYKQAGDPMDMARARLDYAFEFFSKLGVPFFCFHDTDLAPEADTLSESLKRTDQMVELVKEKMQETGIGVLFGSQNLFENRRFMAGGFTNPSPDVFAWAAAKTKKMIEVCHELDAGGQAFWGGREGYATMLNTDVKHDQEQQAAFFHMAVDYKQKIGFKGQFYIEPKPREPLKRQYDFNVAAVHAFLQRYSLTEHIKVNLEANHATLANTAFLYEIEYAFANDIFGSLDANRGDKLLGWDTDQFPTDRYQAALVMHSVLKHGGFTNGGLNFDCKLRRQSIDPLDLFYAHIGAMDTYARGLQAAAKMLQDGVLEEIVKQRYSGWETDLGRKILNGKCDFSELQQHAMKIGEPELQSGHQELLENILNDYV